MPRTMTNAPAITYDAPIRKSYRRLMIVRLNGVAVATIGWCPAANRNYRNGLTPELADLKLYGVFSMNSDHIARTMTLAEAKRAVTRWLGYDA